MKAVCEDATRELTKDLDQADQSYDKLKKVFYELRLDYDTLREDLREEQAKLRDTEERIAHYKGKYRATPEAPTRSPSTTTTEATTRTSSLMKRKAMDRTPSPSQEALPPPTETPAAENLLPQKKAKGDAFLPFCNFYDTGIFTSEEERVPSPEPKEAPAQTEANKPQLNSQSHQKQLHKKQCKALLTEEDLAPLPVASLPTSATSELPCPLGKAAPPNYTLWTQEWFRIVSSRMLDSSGSSHRHYQCLPPSEMPCSASHANACSTA